MKFKIGDKVVLADGKGWLNGKKYKIVTEKEKYYWGNDFFYYLDDEWFSYEEIQLKSYKEGK